VIVSTNQDFELQVAGYKLQVNLLATRFGQSASTSN